MALTIEELTAFLQERPPRLLPERIERAGVRPAAVHYMWPGLFLFAALLLAYILGLHQLPVDIKLDYGQPVAAPGVVTAAEKTGARYGGRGRRGKPFYRIRYRFTTADRREHEGVCFVTGGTHHPGRRLAVEHLPEDPTISRIPGSKHAFGGYFSLLSLLFIVPAFLFWYFIRRARARSRALLVDGVFASATVTGLVDTGVRVAHDKRYRIEFVYAGADGEYRGHAHAFGDLAARAQALKNKGETAGVLYRADDRKHVLWVDALLENVR